MLVVKILPAKSSKFEGVAYSDNKINHESSELISEKNFVGLSENSSKEEYKMFLQKHSEANKRVKNPQFHASISAKGKETSFDDLKVFGEHYMEQMGYGKNPYLIYKHTDTENNHIHIVSSRVDGEGKKISDNFERLKSQKIINQYFGLDIQKEVEQKLNKIDKFNISTIAQYKLLLERNFKKVIEKDSIISIYQSDKKIDINKESINKIIIKGSKAQKRGNVKERKKELNFYLTELSKKHSLEEIQVIAKKKNIDIEVFKTKDNKSNFGYSVIDNKTKNVFKGSEIVPLKVLENNKEKTKNIVAFIDLLDALKLPKDTLEDINTELNRIGKSIDSKGIVSDISKDKPEILFTLPKSSVYDFNYNSILKSINNKYVPLSENDARILSFLFKVKKADIEISENANDKNKVLERSEIADFYNHSLKFFINNNYDIKDQLKENSIELFKMKDEFYVIDKEREFIGNIQLDEDVEKVIEEKELYTELAQNNGYEQIPMENHSIENILNNVSQLFGYSDEKEKKKGKKRSQKGNSY